MASRLGRLARLTLYSGPNCSLCDVSAGVIASDTSLSTGMLTLHNFTDGEGGAGESQEAGASPE